jgi:hypothetical protein
MIGTVRARLSIAAVVGVLASAAALLAQSWASLLRKRLEELEKV